jgi:hypothetical protein
MAERRLKVVAHLRDGSLVKGYTDALASTELESLLKGDVVGLPPEMTIYAAGSEQTVTFPLESLKALFFVKTFEGQPDYHETKFFEGHPLIEGLWVRVRFQDGETVEGIVRNSLHYIVDPGFLLKPPDPQSNNQILYVVKNSLQEFQVLGVRHTY